jgi:hypothetical protein
VPAAALAAPARAGRGGAGPCLRPGQLHDHHQRRNRPAPDIAREVRKAIEDIERERRGRGFGDG